MAPLFNVLAQHSRIESLLLEFHASFVFDEPSACALAQCLRGNATLTAIQPDAPSLLGRSRGAGRTAMLDALRVSIINADSTALLPNHLRRVFRHALSLPMPDAVVVDVGHADSTGLLIDGAQLAATMDTWQQIGKGAFGVVYKTLFRGETVVIKTIKAGSTSELETCFREFALLLEIRGEVCFNLICILFDLLVNDVVCFYCYFCFVVIV
jgi:hypothetical protein